MAKYKVAGNTVIRCDASAGGTLVNISSFVDTVNPGFAKSVASLDVTSFADAAERVIGGIELADEITIEGAYDDSGTANPDAIFGTAVGTNLSFEFNPIGTTGGMRKITGEYMVMTHTVSSDVKERVVYSTVIKKDGTITIGTN